MPNSKQHKQLGTAKWTKSGAQTFLRRAVLFVLSFGALASAQEPQAKQSSADVMRTFKTIYVQSKTPLAKPQMLAGELQKLSNFDKWGLSITSETSGADVVVEIDHQPGWFYYTYSMTHPSTGLVLAVGRVDAWDGKYASAKIAKEIMKRTAAVREPPKEKK
jgi:hypothetical protein